MLHSYTDLSESRFLSGFASEVVKAIRDDINELKEINL